MTHIVVATPPMKKIEEFDALIKNLQDPPEGMRARYVGTCGNELRIVSVWDTQEHADRFYANTLAPALAKTFGPETELPQADRFEVAREYSRELVG
jgi:hypothetical protein